MTRRVPYKYDEAESEAYLALGEAFHRWGKDGGAGMHYLRARNPEHRFYVFAAIVIRRRVYNLIREIPLGFRTRESRKSGADRGGVPDVGDLEEGSEWELVPSDTHEVGWEYEYEDLVRFLSSRMSPLPGVVFLHKYLVAGCDSPAVLGERLGIKPRSVNDAHYQSLVFLRGC